MINFKQHMENIHPCLLEYFEYYCMDNEIARKVLINPTTGLMKLVRTNV